MVRMGPDIDQDHRTSDPGWIKTPSRRNILRSQVPLNVLKMELADGPDGAIEDHSASLAHHRVGGVGVGQTELKPAVLHLLGQTYGRCQVGSERFVADDMEPGVQGRATDLVVTIVRRHYRDNVDPIFPLRLTLHEFAPGWISPFFRHSNCASCSPGSFRVR